MSALAIAERYAAWMGRALDEAATPGTGPAAMRDVPVGAVVLAPDGSELGVGRNVREAEGDPTGHAELVAIRAAAATSGSWRLEGCTLVVTLEPCPMCAGAAMNARIARIVFGAWDLKAGACGSVWDLVRDRRAMHRVEVVGGVRQDECAALLVDFFGPRRL